MALPENKLKKLQQALEGLKDIGGNGPVVAEWPDADGFGRTVMIDNKLFGSEYAYPYVDLGSITDALLSNEEAVSTILSFYRHDQEPISAGDLAEFLEIYSDEAKNCNTSFKAEFLQHAGELERLVSESRPSKPHP